MYYTMCVLYVIYIYIYTYIHTHTSVSEASVAIVTNELMLPAGASATLGKSLTQIYTSTADLRTSILDFRG